MYWTQASPDAFNGIPDITITPRLHSVTAVAGHDIGFNADAWESRSAIDPLTGWPVTAYRHIQKPHLGILVEVPPYSTEGTPPGAVSASIREMPQQAALDIFGVFRVRL